jgi:hypothetical protein
MLPTNANTNARAEHATDTEFDALAREVEVMLSRIAEGWRMATDARRSATRVQQIEFAAKRMTG